SWSASTNATSYNIRRSTTDGGPYTFIANVMGTNYTDSALSNGVPHYYVVSALNLAGESGYSAQAGVPAQYFMPTGLSVTPVSATQMSLTWDAFPGATAYNVKRSPVSGGPYSVVAAEVGETSFTDTVPEGMRYYYVVSAIAEG